MYSSNRSTPLIAPRIVGRFALKFVIRQLMPVVFASSVSWRHVVLTTGAKVTLDTQKYFNKSKQQAATPQLFKFPLL